MSGTTIRVVPYGDPSTAPRNSPSQALENLRAVKAPGAAFGGAGVLYGIAVTNTGPAQFLHCYDSATSPAGGAVPVLCVALPAGATAALDLGAYGLGFQAGLYVGNSSTAATRTAGAGDCLFYPRFL
ncbi:MAG: hypothetical protein V4505_00625 [Pseudomonadota bacterium]